jgi:hypothetical protein
MTKLPVTIINSQRSYMTHQKTEKVARWITKEKES